jgi:hypothetical protein
MATTTVILARFAPSFNLLDTKHVAGIIIRSDSSGAYGGGTYDIIGPTGSSLGYPTVAAKAGDTVELFGVGFGPTNPPVLAGAAYVGSAPTTNPVTLSIGNRSLSPSFAGETSAGLSCARLGESFPPSKPPRPLYGSPTIRLECCNNPKCPSISARDPEIGVPKPTQNMRILEGDEEQQSHRFSVPSSGCHTGRNF